MGDHIHHDTLSVRKTAHVFTYGNRETAKVAVLVCHGYAQLADRIIRKFDKMSENDVFVVSPEGLSTFYWEGVSGDPVASWMTKRNRLDDISDFIDYLDQIYNRYIQGFEGKIVLMGFSQGCATIWRWLHQRAVHMDHMINWAGWIPEDIDLSNSLSHLTNPIVHLVVGNQDQYLTDDRVAAMNHIIDKNQLPVKHYRFEGKHVVERKLLGEIINNIV